MDKVELVQLPENLSDNILRRQDAWRIFLALPNKRLCQGESYVDLGGIVEFWCYHIQDLSTTLGCLGVLPFPLLWKTEVDCKKCTPMLL
jgi:hypothetical protein